MPYKLSKDYRRLFAQISKGEIAAAYVDYTFSVDSEVCVCRDICDIKRHEPYRINIGIRGMCYGHVYSYMQKDGDEEVLFIRECQRLNLEWIPIN